VEGIDADRVRGGGGFASGVDGSHYGKKTGCGPGALQSRRVSASSTYAPTLTAYTLHLRNHPSNIPIPFPNVSVGVSWRCLAGMGWGEYDALYLWRICCCGGFVG